MITQLVYKLSYTKYGQNILYSSVLVDYTEYSQNQYSLYSLNLAPYCTYIRGYIILTIYILLSGQCLSALLAIVIASHKFFALCAITANTASNLHKYLGSSG